MDFQQLAAMPPIAIIAATVLLTMLAITVRRDFTLSCLLAGLGMAAALATAATGLRDAAVQVTPLIVMDGYGRFYMALLAATGLAALAFSHDYFKQRDGENEELPLLLLTALLGGLVLVASNHLAAFFIGLETLSISLFVLIAYSSDQDKSLEAAIKYLILSGVSSAFLLMGMAFIYARCGVLDFPGVGHYIAGRQHSDIMVLGGVMLVVAGMAFKLSLVPFHMWAADVYQGAPAPVTAFIATVSKGAVFILLLRYFLSTGSYGHSQLLNVFSTIAVLTILAGNLLALQQQNIKRILAYSSIAHLGYLTIIFIAGGNMAAEAAGFYLTAYFISTLGAFGVVAILSTAQTEAAEPAIYQGLFWRRPWLAAAFSVMLLSLAGIPPTAGFIGKFYVFVAGSDAKLWGLLLTLIIGSGLGLYYYLRIIVVMFLDAENIAPPVCRPAGKRLSHAALAILTILTVWLGIYPDYLMALLQG
ncbi:MAG: NADH-quinone oxidoreductase subunit N [Methylococcales bacterium]|nr:NADH-quinone oxidoreductase subunit N [Methylococcales bacterium]